MWNYLQKKGCEARDFLQVTQEERAREVPFPCTREALCPGSHVTLLGSEPADARGSLFYSTRKCQNAVEENVTLFIPGRVEKLA